MKKYIKIIILVSSIGTFIFPSYALAGYFNDNDAALYAQEIPVDEELSFMHAFEEQEMASYTPSSVSYDTSTLVGWFKIKTTSWGLFLLMWIDDTQEWCKTKSSSALAWLKSKWPL